MIKICKVCGKSKSMLPYEDTCYTCEKEQELKRIQEQIKSGKENVDTFSTDYVICPYCGYAHETNLGYEDFPEIYEEGENKINCDECGKTFVMETTVAYYWETRRMKNDT